MWRGPRPSYSDREKNKIENSSVFICFRGTACYAFQLVIRGHASLCEQSGVLHGHVPSCFFCFVFFCLKS